MRIGRLTAHYLAPSTNVYVCATPPAERIVVHRGWALTTWRSGGMLNICRCSSRLITIPDVMHNGLNEVVDVLIGTLGP
jgi:hypothetical protein